MAAERQMALGSTLMGLGTVLGGIGAIGLFAYGQMIKGAVDYNQAAALTLTQVDDHKISLEDIKRVARDVAKEIPAPFDQMQQSLFDIFSSMDTNLAGAERMLRAFSKGAVAGQAELQSVGRATIALMNAFNIPVTEVTRVMDVQFQLVRKGVGTYDQFATTIGRAIPAAKATGQEIESLAGMLAFLTRNGLSTAQASTSAARAMELMASPKVTANLENYGVEVKNADGSFRQLNEIVTDLATNKGWAQMAEPERKKMFQEIFGTGSIQARRFFDVAIPNFKDLNARTLEMHDSAGAMGDAYDIMFEQPASQSQLLKNNIQALGTEMGDIFLPLLNDVVQVGLKLVRWFDNLPSGVKKAIVIFGAVAAVLLVITGVVTVIVGGFIALGAAAALAGVGMGVIVAIIAGIVAAIVVLGVAIVGIIMHWDTLKRWAGTAWNAIKEGASAVWDVMQQFWDWLSGTFINVWHDLQGLWDTITSTAVDAWHTIQVIWDQVWQAIVGSKWFQDLMDIVAQLVGWIQETWGNLQETFEHFKQNFMEVFSIVMRYAKFAFNIIWKAAQFAWDVILAGLRALLAAFEFIWGLIGPIVKEAWDLIWEIVSFALDFLLGLWNAWGDNVLAILEGAWDMIIGIIKGAIDIIGGIINFFLALFRGDWGEMWEYAKQVLSGAWQIILSVIQGAWSLIKNLFMIAVDFIRVLWNTLWEWVPKILKAAWNFVVSIIRGSLNFALGIIKSVHGWMKDIIGGAMDWIKDRIAAAWDWVKTKAAELLGKLVVTIREKFNELVDKAQELAGKLKEKGIQAIRDFISGIVDRAQGLWNWFRDLPGKVIGAIGNLGSKLIEAGKELIRGLIRGITSMFDTVKNTLGDLGGKLVSWKGPPEKDAKMLFTNGQLIIQGLIYGIESQRTPLKHTLEDMADLIALYNAPPDELAHRLGIAPPVGLSAMGTPGGTSHNYFDITFSFPNVTDKEGIEDVIVETMHDVVTSMRQRS
jgi:TP901 family phage tail tape measure protein